MEPQSTDHILLIEPAAFYANPQTMPTNQYQHEDATRPDEILSEALREFNQFRDALVKAGVAVTTLRGSEDCPDHIFCNWVSFHPNRRMVLYPMLAENRRAERLPSMLKVLARSYDLHVDLREFENEGKFLEATGSLALDRMHKVAYAAQSARTNMDLAEKWCEAMGYTLVSFGTQNHAGEPVYHTDLTTWIGTDIAACCFDCIVEEDRERVRASLQATGRKIVSLSMDELAGFAGNSLQLHTMNGRTILAMSSRAYASLSAENRAILEDHFDEIVHTSLTTVERYGGGSARCMITELF